MNAMKWMGMLVLILTLCLVGPSIVQAVELNNSEEPGSVIVFPKFLKGVLPVGGLALPATEIEVSVLCPKGSICAEGTKVKLRGHWVCPGSQDPSTKFVCKEVDFSVFTTVNGTISINPSRVAVPGGTLVPTAPCRRGYLIMWVTDTSDRPIKFDGLIGDAVIRHDLDSAGAYNAVPIQAVSALATNALVPLSGGALNFDGATGYKALTGAASGTVRFDRLVPTKISTFLTFLTLDVLSNRPNFPTFVDMVFWNQFETATSVSTDFICWAEIALTSNGDPVNFLDDNLDEIGQGTRKGSFLSDPAEKVAIFGVTDTAGPVTLLGIVETQEPTGEYSYSMHNDGVPVTTKFKP